MIENIELHYHQIAESMIEAIPEDWSSASFEAIFFPDGSVYEAEYTRKADGLVRGFQPGSGGARAFRNLRQGFKDAAKPLWGSARFDLREDGSFDLKFVYEKCDEDGNSFFDGAAEVRRHEARRKRLTQS